jgi:membrane protein implicated in regulation of membrane protease activity
MSLKLHFTRKKLLEGLIFLALITLLPVLFFYIDSTIGMAAAPGFILIGIFGIAMGLPLLMLIFPALGVPLLLIIQAPFRIFSILQQRYYRKKNNRDLRQIRD